MAARLTVAGAWGALVRQQELLEAVRGLNEDPAVDPDLEDDAALIRLAQAAQDEDERRDLYLEALEGGGESFGARMALGALSIAVAQAASAAVEVNL